MLPRVRSRAILAILTTVLIPGTAPGSDLSGPFPIRSQFPFHLLFLDVRPVAAAPVSLRGWRLGAVLTYENTHAATDELVRLYNEDDFQTYDGVVTPEVLAAVAAVTPDGTAYIMDTETARLLVDATLGLRPWLEIGLEIPFLAHRTGFMDTFIDSYHERFNFPDGGRVGFAQDRFHAGYTGDGASVFVAAPPGPGIGDIAIRGRALLRSPAPGKTGLSAGLELKLPTGDPDRLHGSGSFDLGVNVAISRDYRRFSLHGGAGYTRVGSWEIAPTLPIEDSRGLYVAWGYAATGRTAVIGQILLSSGAFPRRSGSDIGRDASEIVIGVRHRGSGGLDFEYGLLENLGSLHNAPDVGFFFGVSRRIADRPLP